MWGSVFPTTAVLPGVPDGTHQLGGASHGGRRRRGSSVAAAGGRVPAGGALAAAGRRGRAPVRRRACHRRRHISRVGGPTRRLGQSGTPSRRRHGRRAAAGQLLRQPGGGPLLRQPRRAAAPQRIDSARAAALCNLCRSTPAAAVEEGALPAAAEPFTPSSSAWRVARGRGGTTPQQTAAVHLAPDQAVLAAAQPHGVGGRARRRRGGGVPAAARRAALRAQPSMCPGQAAALARPPCQRLGCCQRPARRAARSGALGTFFPFLSGRRLMRPDLHRADQAPLYRVSAGVRFPGGEWRRTVPLVLLDKWQAG